MGLIQKANRIQVHSEPLSPRDSVSTKGLLRKISDSSLPPYDRFLSAIEDFFKEIRIEKGGLLVQNDEKNAVLLYPRNLDLTSIRRCTIPIDITSQFKTDGWTNLDSTHLDILYPFFSSHERDSLLTVHFHPFNVSTSKRAWILCVRSLLDNHSADFDPAQAESALSKFQHIVPEYTSLFDFFLPYHTINQSTQSVKDKTRAALDSGKSAHLVTIDLSRLFPNADKILTDPETSALHTAIVQRISKKAGFNNITLCDDNCNVKLAVFTSQTMDIQFYCKQILHPLENVFGSKRINAISIIPAGCTLVIQEINAFLYGGN